MKKIKKSKLYERITQNDFIYNAIYSLESYIFEKDLLDKEDYILMLKLKDPFDHAVIDKTIKDVKEKIKKVLIEDDFFEAQIYLRPKKVNEQDEIESRPLHSASLITQIASVVLLNTLLIEIDDDKNKIELTELARTLPANFYGNIPSEKPEYLFKPWNEQFKAYTDAITKAYDEYVKTKEYKYEISLDLKNFFPSINPAIIYDEIMSKYSMKYDEEDKACLKQIILKLLFFKISNLKSEKLKKMYYACCKSNENIEYNWSKGIPQGLPHSYFFGNICMVKVAEIFNEIIVKKGKAFYYVDDSVIYTNEIYINKDKGQEIEDALYLEIKEVNEKLKKLGESCEEKLKLENLDFYTPILAQFEYKIEVHEAKSEKSSILEIKNSKYGQANLNAYSKQASVASYDLNKVFSEREEINLFEKLKIIYEAVEKEIKRIIDQSDGKNKNANYLKVLFRFKKFFKYRKKQFEFNKNNKNESIIIDEFLLNFEIDNETKNKEKFKKFFKACDEDILLNEIRFFFKNSPYFLKKYKGIIDNFNKEIYKDVFENEGYIMSYFDKICKSLSIRKEIEVENESSKYDSIKKIVRKNIWISPKRKIDLNENEIKQCMFKFFDIFFNKNFIYENNEIELIKKDSLFDEIELIIKDSVFYEKNTKYNLINIQTDELYRIIINAYFSELFSINISDFNYFEKSNNKPIYYNEARILIFLRNKNFSLEQFYLKFKKYTSGESLDYTLFEVVDYFEKFVKNSVYIDNLIMVHKYTSDLWKNGSKYLHFYTLHNQEHAIELIKKIVTFIKSVDYFQISKKDYYVLFISCYLHDISMVLHPNLIGSFVKDKKESNMIYSYFKRELRKENIKEIDYIEEETIKRLLVTIFTKLDQYYENDIRDNHPKQSAMFIRKTKDFNFVEDEIKDIVAEVSQAHGYDTDEVYKTKSIAKDSLLSEKYMKILLRMGDLLDMSCNRISNAILDNNQNSMSDTSRFHWLSHKAISNVDIQTSYSFNEVKKNNSYIGPGSITEKIIIVINLNIKHLIGVEKTNNCDGIKYEKNKSEFNIIIDEKIECEKCSFMCKWMKEKNNYLYKELDVLKKYLNRSKANLFKTDISVKYKFNDDAIRLNNSEYEYILNYIKNK